jgi:hypothetical protein
MGKLSLNDLYTLEDYSVLREEFRASVMAHKKHRQVPIGPHVTLYFEDRLTMHYQVQEMLRAERIFEREGIEEELETYNALIPDGSNWKATLMIEYDDVAERRQALARMIGIEREVWVRVADFEKVRPIANEDLERETEEKTSSVHFLRFELSDDMVAAVKAGASIGMGIDHPAYRFEVASVGPAVRDSLSADLN